MRLWKILACVIGLLTLGPAAQAAPEPVADWLVKPTGDDISGAYPAFARQLGIEGHATITCRIGISGHVTGCFVIEERPKGYGFGAAALTLSSQFQMTPTAGFVNIPISFQLPPGAPRGLLAGLAIAMFGLVAMAAAAALNDRLRGWNNRGVAVGDALRYSVAFAGRAWRRAPAPLALSCLPTLFNALRHGAASSPETYAWLIYSFVVGLIAQGALLRLGLTDLRPDDPDLQPAAWGLRAGRTERRLITASLIYSFCAVLLIAALALVVAIATPVILMLHPSPAAQTELAVGAGVIAAAVVLFFALRLTPWFPAVAYTKRLGFRATWTMTKAAVFAPFAAISVLMLAALVALIIVAAVFSLMGRMVGTGFTTAGTALATVIIVGLWTPALAGVSIYMFRKLSPLGNTGIA